jgi:hypothetical protein
MVNICYLFVSVQMAENSVFCKYLTCLHSDLLTSAPMKYRLMTCYKANLLNKINKDVCIYEYWKYYF